MVFVPWSFSSSWEMMCLRWGRNCARRCSWLFLRLCFEWVFGFFCTFFLNLWRFIVVLTFRPPALPTDSFWVDFWATREAMSSLSGGVEVRVRCDGSTEHETDFFIERGSSACSFGGARCSSNRNPSCRKRKRKRSHICTVMSNSPAFIVYAGFASTFCWIGVSVNSLQ